MTIHRSKSPETQGGSGGLGHESERGERLAMDILRRRVSVQGPLFCDRDFNGSDLPERRSGQLPPDWQWEGLLSTVIGQHLATTGG